MKKTQQLKATREAQQKAQNAVEKALNGVWPKVRAAWVPGKNKIGKTHTQMIRAAIRRGYDAASQELLPADWKVYRQAGDDPYNEAMSAIGDEAKGDEEEHLKKSLKSIAATVAIMMGLSFRDASEDNKPGSQAHARAAKAALLRRLSNHTLTIAVTEGNWAANSTFRTAVVAVADTLGNTVERIASLIEDGDIAAARRLSKEALRLARLPTSVMQGELLDYINDARDRLTTPGTQGRIVATMRQRAEELGSQQKEWQALFHNTRPSHAAADGQRKAIDEPYTVGGAQMMYPMDGSLGAPLSEIINCQCVNVYL